jgi:hypothetical protein
MEKIMAANKSRRKTNSERSPEQEGFLTAAARSVGYAAGKAAKAIGLDHPDSSAAVARKPEIERAKTLKRPSARARRKNQAEKAKSKAAKLLSKGSADPGAPFRRVMGKPAANWSGKDIEYVNGLVAKQNA